MRKFAPILCLALALLMCASFASAESADNSLELVKEAGKLILGFDASFPPMGYTQDDGSFAGFDLDVAAEVVKLLGVELELQPIDWSAKDLELNVSRSIDCIWNGFTITEERRETVNYSIPYLGNAQVLVIRADAGYETLADLAGKPLGLQAGSSAVDALADAPEFAATLSDVAEFGDYMVALLDLEQGGVDAVLMDTVVANYYITEKGANLSILGEALVPEQFGIGFRKEDIALTDAVNAALIELKANGTLGEISTKWFGSDITIVPAE
ncbi:MAG: amino acid ABC transporter substrate-binding protein [Oscillospiraceae bacterium]|jgi:polar amino acid transport system substrate-binding protein|nr:amino acid ABC transporter substrate-binding protein [Oscillospiraceae bacterium]